MWSEATREELMARRAVAAEGGGQDRIDKQHAAGKLTARERIDILFDEGTFVEVNTLLQAHERDICLPAPRIPGDGVVTGYGRIEGRWVFAAAEDFTVVGGTLGEYHSKKIIGMMDMAVEMRRPFIMLNDSGGARIEEGVCSLNGYSGIFLRNTYASGIIPQIAVIMGPCAGGACYSPAICDFVFMVEGTSQMFITGPAVIKAVTHEETTVNELGGARVHTSVSGAAHFSYPDDASCLLGVRKLLSYLPQNNHEYAPQVRGETRDRSDEIESIVPEDQRRTYDVRKVIDTFVDEDSFFEVHKAFARNIVVGLARLEGKVIGIIANQPAQLGGSLDVDASNKAARFVRFCDGFNIPLITLVDVPAFLPGVRQEHSGIIRHGAKLLYAYAEASVPKITLIMRKAYGGAYIAMGSKGMGADVVYAWPIAELAVMGEEGAVDIMYRKQLDRSEHRDEERRRLVEEYKEKFITPYISAANGYIDEIILPDETRSKLYSALDMLNYKADEQPPKKHGNIPL